MLVRAPNLGVTTEQRHQAPSHVQDVCFPSAPNEALMKDKLVAKAVQDLSKVMTVRVKAL